MTNDNKKDNVTDLKARRRLAQRQLDAASRAETLSRLADAVAASERKPPEFLAAWKAVLSWSAATTFR